MSAQIDPVELARALIGRPSVTPEDAGALEIVEQALAPLGFACRRYTFSEPGTADVENLYAQVGGGGPNFCFAGHTDVVPVGDRAGWSSDPFDAEIRNDVLYGRGATDMKGAVAAFCAAVSRFLAARGPEFGGAISLLITGDEEGVAINGTRKLLEAIARDGETLDVCLLGEPTNPDALGEMIKIGRRGSLSGEIRVTGVQGHTAYPHLADNPLPRLIAMLSAITGEELDDGTAHFQPSNLQITSIDVGNPAFNVIPASGTARFNIRFNDLHSGASLKSWLRERLDRVGGAYDLDISVSGESFLTPPGAFSDLVAACVESVTGSRPELSTTGGTSDARFIKDYCPVVEFGLISQSMHKIDEHVALADLRRLTNIYEAVLDGFFPR